ncbi:MAG: SDR family oxidoreductase [Myxococcota bacterium]|jgi:NAD(P)-dependent dehydrogenase (short-subunit alcohol dehydrogenase family)|nr:SDR family oxidoreductase [Myxococcota bacterium]
MNRKVAFASGASRGIGAEAAVALARCGFDVAITARTLEDGEAYDHIGKVAPLPGCLRATAVAIEAQGGRALCLQADILDPESIAKAAQAALDEFGRIDLLFNNAAYQGTGNQERLLEVTAEQVRAIYQGNVLTPLSLVQTFLPQMLEKGSGTIINMLSATAFHDPPAPADQGGWGFAYPSSKAALARMGGALRVEHSDAGLRIFDIEPGLVVTEPMKASGIDEAVLSRFDPTPAQSIGAVVAWLAENDPSESWARQPCLSAPALAKELDLLDLPSGLPSDA